MSHGGGARWGIRSLGPLALVPPGGGPSVTVAGMGPNRMRLLAALIALGPAGGTRRRLIEMVWDDPMEPRSLNRLRATLSRLKAGLGPPVGAPDVVVAAPRSRVCLDPARLRVDAWDLLETHHAPPPGADLPLLLAVRGAFMEELADVPWLADYRRRCLEAFRVQCARAGERLQAAGRLDEALAPFRHAVAVDPEDPGHHRRLADLLAAHADAAAGGSGADPAA